MNVDFLKYGELGALVLVLGAVGLFLRNWLKGEQERQAKREEREAERGKESRQDQRDLNRAFQELVAQDIESKQMLNASLDGLCSGIQANQDSTAAAITELVEGQRVHERRASERHQQNMEQGRQIVDALKALNGHS